MIYGNDPHRPFWYQGKPCQFLPGVTPPRFCMIEGNVLMDDAVPTQTYDPVAGLGVQETLRVRRCETEGHDIWHAAMFGSVWVKVQ